MGLGGVLDHEKVSRPGQFDNLVDRGRAAVKVNRDHRARPVRDLSGQGFGGDIMGDGVGFDGDGQGAHLGDGQPGRDEGVRGHQYLVPRTDPEGAQHQRDGIKPVANRRWSGGCL